MKKYEEFVDGALQAADPQIAIAHALLALAAALEQLRYDLCDAGTLTIRLDQE